MEDRGKRERGERERVRREMEGERSEIKKAKNRYLCLPVKIGAR